MRLLTLIIVLAITSCGTHTQLTSGTSYLSRYKPLSLSNRSQADIKNFEAKLRKVASVEPTLRFPARIGLARLENGHLTVIPLAEAKVWSSIVRKHGRKYGSFIPVNPLVAKMVSGSFGSGRGRYTATIEDTMNQIRLGAARQHLDLVLIYEIFTKSKRSDNLLSIANITIIGGFILPSQNVEIEGIGNAMLIDVLQGYPFGTSSVNIEKEEITNTAWGGRDKEEKYSDLVKNRTVSKLAINVEKMLSQLYTKLKNKKKKIK